MTAPTDTHSALCSIESTLGIHTLVLKDLARDLRCKQILGQARELVERKFSTFTQEDLHYLICILRDEK